MNVPTKIHQEYLTYVTSFCNKNKLGLILEGSLATGTASEYSDIDLLLWGDNYSNLLNELITGFDKLVMRNVTQNPKGIAILYYENGICVDLDVRKTLISQEIQDNVVLSAAPMIIENEKRRADVCCEALPPRESWYADMRLIHRCAIKYLCKKDSQAQGLAMEINQCLNKRFSKQLCTDNLPNFLAEAFSLFEKQYALDEHVHLLFTKLLTQTQLAL